MQKKKFFVRYFLLLAVFLFAVFIYSGLLLNMQIANAGEYQRIPRTTYTRNFVVPAVRGEIYDRNGVPIVTNKIINNIVIDGTKMTRAEYVGVIVALTEKIKFYGGTVRDTTLPVVSIEPVRGTDGAARYSYSTVLATSQQRRNWLNRFLAANGLDANISAGELVEFLTGKYRLDEHMPPGERDQSVFMTVLGICYDIDRLDVLAGSNTYAISQNVSNALAAAIKENAHNLPGAEIIPDYERVYHFPSTAPHVIGRTGRITPGLEEHYLSLGYPRDAVVGISGAEFAFEEYLRGSSGILQRIYDQDHNLIGEQWLVDRAGNTREPSAGKNVYLTLDIKLQQVAEYSLANTIQRIHGLAAGFEEPGVNGADANAGAAAVIDPDTGEVLALATYPSYDINAFRNPEELDRLNADQNQPFTNRATSGLYEPGSVFKIITSVAALGSGSLTTGERIRDRGIYDAYEGYQPACWRWHRHQMSCGTINVSQALEVSCNYFYFTVAERMGINNLNEYSRKLGLGERTGIEIWDTPGILASPEYAVSRGLMWRGGDLLQASIGQSYNLFSPLQTAVMLGAVVNGGDRYKSTLLLKVEEFGVKNEDNIYYMLNPELIESAGISAANLNAVLHGMERVTEPGGTAAVLRFPSSVRLYSKTGTAQTGEGRSSNGTFVAHAQSGGSKISMSIVIERGSRGTWAGYVAEDVVAYYFGYRSFEDAMGIETEQATP
jgi:penicillin-binding protein 2